MPVRRSAVCCVRAFEAMRARSCTPPGPMHSLRARIAAAQHVLVRHNGYADVRLSACIVSGRRLARCLQRLEALGNQTASAVFPQGPDSDPKRDKIGKVCRPKVRARAEAML